MCVPVWADMSSMVFLFLLLAVTEQSCISWLLFAQETHTKKLEKGKEVAEVNTGRKVSYRKIDRSMFNVNNIHVTNASGPSERKVGSLVIPQSAEP